LGYDLVSRKGNEEKFIEVKGISSGETVILTLNEYKASQIHSPKFYLYVVRDPLKNPTLIIKRPPFTIEHTHCVIIQYEIKI
ncbi:MAG: DUF3883 domain-containing protein, partial [Nitrososphaeria archaeon]